MAEDHENFSFRHSPASSWHQRLIEPDWPELEANRTLLCSPKAGLRRSSRAGGGAVREGGYLSRIMEQNHTRNCAHSLAISCVYAGQHCA